MVIKVFNKNDKLYKCDFFVFLETLSAFYGLPFDSISQHSTLPQ